MAKKTQTGEVNKSQQIRDILTASPKTPIKEVIRILGEKGISVTDSLVYIVKGKMKAKRRRQIRQNVEKLVATPGHSDALSTIRKVKGLAHEVGGLGKLRALVEALAE